MTMIGEIISGKLIGKNPKFNYLWHACTNCGKERWITIHGGKHTDLCVTCSNKIRRKYTLVEGQPKIGEKRNGLQIGKGTAFYIWLSCDICGIPRWAKMKKGQPLSTKCPGCSRRKYIPHNKGTAENPIEGDIYFGREINKHGNLFIYHSCERCRNLRWVEYSHGKPISTICVECSKAKYGSECSNWRGGLAITRGGYRYVWIDRKDFFYSMSTQGRVVEHRLIMAKHLGRCLQNFEIVHHKNGIKTDNRIENLELATKNSHIKEHSQGYCDGYRRGYQDGIDIRIKELAKEIRLLQLQLSGALNEKV
jgi:hypothetical protein